MGHASCCAASEPTMPLTCSLCWKPHASCLLPRLHFPDSLQSVEATRDWLIRREAGWLLREVLGFTIRHGENGHYLGSVELHSIAWDQRYFALGYWLRSGAERRGYMSEAVRLLTDYAFEALGANKVALRCDARNTRSAAVAERLGFVREARLRGEAVTKDRTVADELQYGLLPRRSPLADHLTRIDLSGVLRLSSREGL